LAGLGSRSEARGAEEGRSFLSKPSTDKNSVSTYLGEKLFPEIITLRSDPFHRKLASTPWDQSLLPNEKIPWIEKGVVKNLSYDRFWHRRREEPRLSARPGAEGRTIRWPI